MAECRLALPRHHRLGYRSHVDDGPPHQCPDVRRSPDSDNRFAFRDHGHDSSIDGKRVTGRLRFEDPPSDPLDDRRRVLPDVGVSDHELDEANDRARDRYGVDRTRLRRLAPNERHRELVPLSSDSNNPGNFGRSEISIKGSWRWRSVCHGRRSVR